MRRQHTIRYRDRSIASVTLPHRLGLAARSVLSRNTRSAYKRPARRPMRCWVAIVELLTWRTMTVYARSTTATPVQRDDKSLCIDAT